MSEQTPMTVRDLANIGAAAMSTSITEGFEGFFAIIVVAPDGDMAVAGVPADKQALKGMMQIAVMAIDDGNTSGEEFVSMKGKAND